MNALFARLMNNRILLQTILLLKRLFVEENTLHMTYNSAASNLFCQLTMKFRSISKPVNLLAYSFIQVMSVVLLSFILTFWVYFAIISQILNIVLIIWFQTYSGNGLDYMNLALKDGGIALTVALGTGKLDTAIGPDDVRFDDNVWHHVLVKRHSSEVSTLWSRCSTTFPYITNLNK